MPLQPAAPGVRAEPPTRRGKLQIKRTERRGKGPGVGTGGHGAQQAGSLCARELRLASTVNAEVIFPSFWSKPHRLDNDMAGFRPLAEHVVPQNPSD